MLPLPAKGQAGVAAPLAISLVAGPVGRLTAGATERSAAARGDTEVEARVESLIERGDASFKDLSSNGQIDP